MSILERIFSQAVHAKKNLNFPEDDLSAVIEINRKSLSLVDNWIDNAAMESSCFEYGIPKYIRNDINKPIGSSITYTDIMLYLSKKYFSHINYLEIGVSVGKNFFQLLNGQNKGRFTGFDIEEINPVLEQKLVFKNKEEWTTPGKSIKKTSSSIKQYSFREMDVAYLSADVWDENSWAKLKGNKYNIIFSDALHTPEAILFEFEMLVKYDLLDDKFIIFWDDLIGKMRRSFYNIIKKYKKVYQIEDIYLLQINGWIGEHEDPHSVGIISSFSF
jgi:hypothetical protein